jgi:putative oxidoreductase
VTRAATLRRTNLENREKAVNARNEDLARSIGLLVLRLGIGGYMMSHGESKLRMLLAGDFHRFGDPIGLGSAASLVLVTLAEFFAALLVLLGLATRWAAIPVVFAMAVAAFIAHGGDPWTMQRAAELFAAGEAESWASREPALLYLFPFLALAFTGGGRYSLDAWIARWRAARRDGDPGRGGAAPEDTPSGGTDRPGDTRHPSGDAPSPPSAVDQSR